MSGDHDGQLLSIGLGGVDPGKWAKLRAAFVAKLASIMEATFNPETGATVRDELKSVTSLAIDAAKAKLSQPGADVEKTFAEVSKLYSEGRAAAAQADKASEEARALRIENDVKQLRLMLLMTKSMLVGQLGDELLVIGADCDRMLEALRMFDDERPQKAIGS